MIYDGRLCRIFIDTGRNMLVALPKQNVTHLSDLYPIDLSHLLVECRLLAEHYRLRSYTLRLHRRDWNYSAHAHVQITMPRAAFASLQLALGVQCGGGGGGGGGGRRRRRPWRSSRAGLARVGGAAAQLKMERLTDVVVTRVVRGDQHARRAPATRGRRR